MYCKECGAKTSETSKFCDNCGASVSDIPPRDSKHFYGGGAKFWFIFNIVCACITVAMELIFLIIDKRALNRTYEQQFGISAQIFYIYQIIMYAGQGLVFFFLLTKKCKRYFYQLWIFIAISFIFNAFTVGLIEAILTSVLGAAFSLGITYLVLKKYWNYLE